MIVYPHINPIALRIGPVTLFGHRLGPLLVHWYGVMYLVGFGAAWLLARARARRAGSTWKPADVDDVLFYGMLGVIVGGRIGYVLFYGLSFWQKDAWYPLKIWEGGMSFHGGLLGVIVAMTLFALRRGRRIADVYDFCAPLPCIGIFAVRVGNFINSELWGKPTTVPWGFLVKGQVRHASQLYEATLEGLLLFVVLWWYTSKPRPRWAPSGLFLLLYGLARFAVEFVRIPDEQLGYLAGGWLTMGQVLSFPMILVGAGMLAYAYRRGAPSGNYATAQ
ncbi:MAG TPA: prolipoprotein diacylglyceryl transferase [Steroidobacteraceae bacterium]|nr:prolipoprotein diacylglyceryl transferase [Steroidobacteraceae bacterium]